MLACRDAARQLRLELRKRSSRRATARDARNTKQFHKGCVLKCRRVVGSRGQPFVHDLAAVEGSQCSTNTCVSGASRAPTSRFDAEADGGGARGRGEGRVMRICEMRWRATGVGQLLGEEVQVGQLSSSSAEVGAGGWSWSWSTKRDSSGVASMAEDGWIMDDGEQRRLGKMEARGGAGPSSPARVGGGWSEVKNWA